MPRKIKDQPNREAMPVRTRTIEDYCRLRGVSKRTVWRRAERGLIKLVKLGGVGRTLVVDDEQVLQPVEQGTRSPHVEVMLAAAKAKREARS